MSRRTEGCLDVQGAANQANPLTQSFDVGQHQHLLCLIFCARGRTSAPFVEYPSRDGVWVAICLEYSCQGQNGFAQEMASQRN